MPRRYTLIEHGKVVQPPPRDHPGGPKPEDRVTFDFGDRKVPEPRPEKDRWYKFRVRFIETLGLLLALVILGCIGTIFVFVVVLTFEPHIGHP